MLTHWETRLGSPVGSRPSPTERHNRAKSAKYKKKTIKNTIRELKRGDHQLMIHDKLVIFSWSFVHQLVILKNTNPEFEIIIWSFYHQLVISTFSSLLGFIISLTCAI